ncbi:YslB family protein [Bacillus sp. FJAT-29790]|uniref:YslB family protein n=1 Tax=Bacillus sp. FJAT-29790 TaxID=1895002 RepID=UPI0020B249C8|nr:YslB family protein [Bacillus sp. FJAT-29790]
MSETALDLRPTELKTESVPAFGYELIREVLLHEILGNDAPDILYWAGKRLARKYPLESFSHTVEFFQQAGWGNLSLKKESDKEMELELYSPLIEERCQQNKICTFQLEAGFIAQQVELQKGVICESFEHPRKKGGKVQFTVKWDKKDTTAS